MSNDITAPKASAQFLPAPTSFEEAYRIAKVLAASDLVPKDYREKPENCLVAMQWGADVGLPGLQALQNIAVINGRPSIWGDAAKALALNHRECQDIQEFLTGEGDDLTAVCIAKRKNKRDVEQRFSVADAKKAGLWGKQGPWQNYPKRMLQMRARGFALRDQFPDALRGLVLAEEAQDYQQEKDMGLADVVETKPAIPQIQYYDTDAFKKNLPAWRDLILAGKKTADQVIATVSSKATLTADQIEAIRSAADQEPSMFDQVKAKLEKAEDPDVLDVAADLIGEVEDPAQRQTLGEIYNQRREAMAA